MATTPKKGQTNAERGLEKHPDQQGRLYDSTQEAAAANDKRNGEETVEDKAK